MCHVVTAANFEQEVLQSQQAICLVYHVANSNCQEYLRNADKLVEQLNDSTVVNAGADGKEEKRHMWLKLCSCNADQNRNLASAFAVERAKLPITYFVMQGTIIDKVAGHVKEGRLESILHKFLEHYQKEMNVDLLVTRSKESASSGGSMSPLPAASRTDLRSGASTGYIIQSLTSSLSGSEMIRLPEESEMLDGIRKSIQEAKRKAHGELSELRRELGMDVRTLSGTELSSRYHQATQFTAMASISGLEALYLARCYAAIGDIARRNVVWARKALQDDFEPALGREIMRKLVALTDVNLVKGDLRVGACGAQRLLEREEANGGALHQHLTGYLHFNGHLFRQINERIDTRTHEVCFPSDFAEQLFIWLKDSRRNLPRGRSASPETAAGAVEHWATPPEDAATMIQSINAEKFWQCKTVLTSLLHLHPSDSKAHDARARLASLIH
eukprot:gene10475-7280_t